MTPDAGVTLTRRLTLTLKVTRRGVTLTSTEVTTLNASVGNFFIT